MRTVAKELGVGFIVKNSKTLLHELNDYIGHACAFGDFVLTDPNTHEEIARAHDLYGLERMLHSLPDDVLRRMANTTNVSKWLFA